jgi:murein DD-endopeptidase MepM/ murein hydrolase activator NlpD
MLAELGMVLGDPGHRLADRAGHGGSGALGCGRGRSIATAQAERTRELPNEEVALGVGLRGNLTIDHHPPGAGLVSRYLHLDGDSICVEEGEPVTKGDLIARVGSGPEDPHLHFELRIVVDPSDRRYWSDRNSVAVDPTRPLYRFEAGALPLVPSGGRRP